MTAGGRRAAPALQAFVRPWRRSRNLTLRALAEQAGSKVSTLSGWETGRRRMTLADLAMLAGFYGVHPAAMLLAPGNGREAAGRMRAVLAVAASLSADDAAAWLGIGSRICGRPDGAAPPAG